MEKYIMIKFNQTLFILFFAFISFSFTGSSANASVEQNTCYLTPVLLAESQCTGSTNQYKYSVYVSSGGHTTSFDRVIEVWVIHDQSIVDFAVVTISANEYHSDNAVVFQYANENYGQVTLKIANVNGQSQSICTWREQTQNANNCYSSGGGGFGR
ncbi:hypothetical protein AB9P05_21180 [Roseivirga sp. BDSF3-8]|uniref:hypothetical protein n=1 Tax=Roseivirga sp. BDSF3-8 TaxID=3241598 RepID=UPI003531C1F9